MPKFSHWIMVASFALATCLAVGCGNPKKLQQETSNLKPLMVLYGKYIGQHRGQPPANESEFKEFVKATDTSALPGGAKDVESRFISSRDQKPYVILYGPAKGPPGLGGQPIVAHEQEGVNGKRYVANTLGAIEEVDEGRFRELVPDAQ